MAVPVHIPKLGMTMKDAKLVEWKAQQGEWVKKGSIVLAIETEKVSWEVEAVGSGFLHILVPVGQKALVGDTVGLLAETQEELERIEKEHPPGVAVQVPPAPEKRPVPAEGPAAAADEERLVKASPAARRLAKELDIDLSLVPGTGPGGRITEPDVTRFHEEGPPAPKITPLAQEMARQEGLDISTLVGTGEGGKITREDVERAVAARKQAETAPARVIPFAGMRRTIAENMRASLQNTAQLTTFTEVDATELVRFRDLLREEYRDDASVKISLNDLLILATSRVLKRFPIMNSTLVGDEILLHESVHMGVAVALPEGLIVPVLKNADTKGILQIAREARDLAAKAREGKLTVDEVMGGTFTITNLSMFQVDGATPILKPPETAILGVGRVKDKPAVYKGEIVIRSMMHLSLTLDHQVVDGAPAAAFLTALCRHIEEPYLIMA